MLIWAVILTLTLAANGIASENGLSGRDLMKDTKGLSINVRDVAGIDKLRPVTGGVPVAEGAAPEGSVFVLQDDEGNDVPLQTSVLARWKDGSARWVLLDFQSQPPVGGELDYVLSWREAGEEKPPALEFDDIKVSSEKGTLLNISDRYDVVMSLTDGNGQVCEAVVESTEETSGELRSTLSMKGAFYTPSGERVFQFRMRVSIYAGLSMVRLEPLILIDADKGVIQRIRELKLTIKPRGDAQTVRIGGDPGWEGAAGSGVRLLQCDDQNYSLEGAEGKGGKAPGWAEMDNIAVALRDFWQQWPKSLEASSDGLSIGLFPSFKDGDYAQMEPWYKYQYLFDGNCYQLRTGQARRWDVWLDLNGDGESLAKMANAPLVPAADPNQAIATGVWDAIAPAGIPEMAEYDVWAENLFRNYCESIEVQRDYGAMNWGDWFGERRVNWGNHEYDTTNQILIQFARTGDPMYLYVADTAARHSSEVDTVHHINDDLVEHIGQTRGYPARPGLVHQHTVGHVSGFYSDDVIRELFIEHKIGRPPNPYLCLSPFNLGHIWTQGMVRQYFLTGDPFLRETVEKIGDNLAQLVEDREYKFMGSTHCGRTTGWPLLALAGAYEMNLDERHLNAMKTLAEDALADQDPVCGGWLIHPMASDHCVCKTARHTGMAGFITAVLINGLSRYYLLSGDDRLPDAIEHAVTFLDNDTWREEWRDWRYTSCPATRATGQPGVVVMAHVNGVRIADNPEHLRVLRVAWDTKFQRLLRMPKPGPGHGKGYSSKMYGCAEAIGLLAARKE